MPKLNSPLPQPLSKECLKAAKIFQSFVDNANNGLDGVIPRSVLEQAKGFAIFTIIKAGFIFSARAGSGVVIARLTDGTWSAPSAIGTAGLGVGTQAGAEVTDFLVVLNSRSAVRSFMAAGSLTLGGNMSIALGPLGRNGEATGAVNTHGKLAAMYSYSKTRGLFGGVSLEGSVIVERQDANALAYHSPVTVRMLLGGAVDPPQWAMPLIKTLESCTGMPGGRDWINDNRQISPNGPYIFGGEGSGGVTPESSVPSFLRKKKRPQYPPASWGTASDSGSFFDDPPRDPEPSLDYYGSNGTHRGTDYDSQFDSDFDPPRPSSKPQFERSPSYGSNPFSPSSGHNRSTSMFTPSTRTYDAYSSSRDESDQLRTSANRNPFGVSRSNSLSSHVYIKPKPELTKPLLPDEGVARAIALYNYAAVESGDLSFSKGDVITVTKMSNSVDDWWTGKTHGRAGIFPANFVELV